MDDGDDSDASTIVQDEAPPSPAAAKAISAQAALMEAELRATRATMDSAKATAKSSGPNVATHSLEEFQRVSICASLEASLRRLRSAAADFETQQDLLMQSRLELRSQIQETRFWGEKAVELLREWDRPELSVNWDKTRALPPHF